VCAQALNSWINNRRASRGDRLRTHFTYLVKQLAGP